MPGTQTYPPGCTAARNRELSPGWCCNTPLMYAARSPCLRLLEEKTAPSTPFVSSMSSYFLFLAPCCFWPCLFVGWFV